MKIKYIMTKGLSPKIACVEHDGEHPFYYKSSVNAFVTYCHEVLTVNEYREIAKRELHNEEYERTHTGKIAETKQK